MSDFLNYTRVLDLYGEQYNLSPRFHFCDVDVTTQRESINEESQNQHTCIMMMDTDREREIGLANKYPFEALEPGEIILHESWQTEFGY